MVQVITSLSNYEKSPVTKTTAQGPMLNNNHARYPIQKRNITFL